MTHLLVWFPVALVLLLATGLAIVISFLAWLLGPKKSSAIKAAPFECGSEPVGSARDRFSVKFYVIALLFIVFDVEAVFLYPWAVLFRELSWTGLVTMSLFLFTLGVGLVYVWKKGALEWE